MSAAGIAAGNTVVASDTELVAAVRGGDDVAFEELYRRYHPRIATFVRRFVRDGGRAEDVSQEAFFSALRRLRQTDTEINFKPWIYEIARNAAIDQYRRSSRSEEVSIDLDGTFAGDVARLPGPAAPDSSVIDKERFDHLRGALDELSETHHRIIVMRELEGLSYREIGDRMELTPAAVESTLFRARRKLEHEYEQLDTGRRCQLMGALIGRLAEGLDSSRDRRRLDRHARRCSHCRRRARELGVEPMLQRTGIAARAAAFLPLPAFARRRFLGTGAESAGAQHAAGPLSSVAAPSLEMGAAMAGKAAAVIATVALVGGGGASLGGVGPLAVGGKGAPAIEKQREPRGGAPAASSEADRRGEATTRGDTSADGAKGKTGQSGDGTSKAPAGSSAAGKAGQGGSSVPSLPALPLVPRSEPPPPPPEGDTPNPSGSGTQGPAAPKISLPAPQLSAPAPPEGSTAAPDIAGAVGTVLGAD